MDTGISWKVYYSDGSTFTGRPEDAPKQGVQVILVKNERVGRRVLKFCDYYVYSPTLQRWLDCADAASVIVRALKEPSVTVLAGEYLNEEDFEKILIAAHNDVDLPPHSGPPPHEAWRN